MNQTKKPASSQLEDPRARRSPSVKATEKPKTNSSISSITTSSGKKAGMKTEKANGMRKPSNPFMN